VVYQSDIGCGEWASPSRRYFTDWLIKVFDGDLVLCEHEFNLADRRVLISIDSKSLGDTIAWFPYVDEFRKKHKCEVVVSTFWNKLFIDRYPDLIFIDPGESVENIYASYTIGCYDDDVYRYKNKFNWRTCPLQKIATDMLGLDYREIKPKIVVNASKVPLKTDYICMSEHSTFQAKYWLYPYGWQSMVDYVKNTYNLNTSVISREPTTLNGIKDFTNRPIDETVATLSKSTMFIGVSSGLAWLAWALNVPVVMISGITGEFHEFQTGVKRVINKNVCNSCLNQPNYVLDRGDWNWCPKHRDFECSKNIHFDMVKSAVDCTLGSKIDTMFYANNGRFIVGPLDISVITDQELPLLRSMYREVFVDSVYDNDHCSIEPGSVVVDIGACIGVFSRFAESKGAKKIYSFEPDYLNYMCLKSNKPDNCIAFNVGVAGKTYIAEFFKDINIGGHSLIGLDVNKTRTGSIENVVCISINDLLCNIPDDKIDYMKIDTEGAEFDIFMSCSDYNLLRINQVVVEFHHMLLNNKSLFNEILAKMSNLGFNSFVVNDYNGHTSMVYFKRIN
jgi:autotransporter strand-loop-strand O-heptosyltransferase